MNFRDFRSWDEENTEKIMKCESFSYRIPLQEENELEENSNIDDFYRRVFL